MTFDDWEWVGGLFNICLTPLGEGTRLNNVNPPDENPSFAPGCGASKGSRKKFFFRGPATKKKLEALKKSKKCGH